MARRAACFDLGGIARELLHEGCEGSLSLAKICIRAASCSCAQSAAAFKQECRSGSDAGMLRRVYTRHRLFCSPKQAEHAALLRASRRAAPMAGTQHKLELTNEFVGRLIASFHYLRCLIRLTAGTSTSADKGLGRTRAPRTSATACASAWTKLQGTAFAICL